MLLVVYNDVIPIHIYIYTVYIMNGIPCSLTKSQAVSLGCCG